MNLQNELMQKLNSFFWKWSDSYERMQVIKTMNLNLIYPKKSH